MKILSKRPEGEFPRSKGDRPEGRRGIRLERSSLLPRGWHVLIVCLLLSGCSAHSPFILENTTDSSAVQNEFPPSQEKVFVTKQPLPASVAFVPISTIDVGKAWYGSSNKVLETMADRARELGANAVIQTKTWHQPAGWSWASPEGSGQAVRVNDLKSLQASGINGTWY